MSFIFSIYTSNFFSREAFILYHVWTTEILNEILWLPLEMFLKQDVINMWIKFILGLFLYLYFIFSYFYNLFNVFYLSLSHFPSVLKWLENEEVKFMDSSFIEDDKNVCLLYKNNRLSLKSLYHSPGRKFFTSNWRVWRGWVGEALEGYILFSSQCK